MQATLDYTCQFLNAYDQRISAEKSVTSHRNIDESLRYTISTGGETVELPWIPPKQHTRVLGYHINLEGTWNGHISEMKQKLKQREDSIGYRRSSMGAKKNLVDYDYFGIVTYSADLVPYPLSQNRSRQQQRNSLHIQK
jgi:hypothetical protein